VTGRQPRLLVIGVAAHFAVTNGLSSLADWPYEASVAELALIHIGSSIVWALVVYAVWTGIRATRRMRQRTFGGGGGFAE
jgi:hypothetical protein